MNTHYKIEGKALSLCNAFGFLFPGEVMLIQAITQTLPEDAVLVNIGAGVGTGSLAMVEMRPHARAFTIDISAGGPEGGMQNEKNAFHNANLPCPVQVLGDSQEVWSHWPEIGKGALIDLLFIDGDHSSTGLQRDIDGWMKFVKPGGIVLFHDYRSVSWADVTEVVNRNMRNPGWSEILSVDTLIAFRQNPMNVGYIPAPTLQTYKDMAAGKRTVRKGRK